MPYQAREARVGNTCKALHSVDWDGQGDRIQSSFNGILRVISSEHIAQHVFLKAKVFLDREQAIVFGSGNVRFLLIHVYHYIFNVYQKQTHTMLEFTLQRFTKFAVLVKCLHSGASQKWKGSGSLLICTSMMRLEPIDPSLSLVPSLHPIAPLPSAASSC
jgi:hypothetical protein